MWNKLFTNKTFSLVHRKESQSNLQMMHNIFRNHFGKQWNAAYSGVEHSHYFMAHSCVKQQLRMENEEEYPIKWNGRQTSWRQNVIAQSAIWPGYCPEGNNSLSQKNGPGLNYSHKCSGPQFHLNQSTCKSTMCPNAILVSSVLWLKYWAVPEPQLHSRNQLHKAATASLALSFQASQQGPTLSILQDMTTTQLKHGTAPGSVA